MGAIIIIDIIKISFQKQPGQYVTLLKYLHIYCSRNTVHTYFSRNTVLLLLIVSSVLMLNYYETLV